MPFLMTLDTNYGEFNIFDLFLFQNTEQYDLYLKGLKLVDTDDTLDIYFGTNQILNLTKEDIESFPVEKISAHDAKVLLRYKVDRTSLVAHEIVKKVQDMESARLEEKDRLKKEGLLKKWYDPQKKCAYRKFVDICSLSDDAEYQEAKLVVYNYSVPYALRSQYFNRMQALLDAAWKKGKEMLNTMDIPVYKDDPIDVHTVFYFLQAQLKG